ncbi:polar amino acid transport system substrate-binding protein [Actinocorallia herbida]|uniref:Polar amino acid transport system substrate-binding protein n=1 Tax=Actinocorallia herbida TaxID=58109 RepID=A0A3N1D5L2_9ACTN|nr:ABC transporter substrate-binding protein [Actinocorallia herbida]ROO88845.1 polar amino acid transport system substrate-binding protein [Actinocorallia herbida]
MRSSTSRRTVAAGAVVLAAAVGLTACGDDTDTAPTDTPPAAALAADKALADAVPADVKADGKIVIGVDSSYAPNEFLDEDGKTVTGWDVALFDAVAAKIGLKTEWVSSSFDGIIPGIGSGKYEVGVSSFTINPERLQAASMVSYFSAGTQWFGKAGATISPDDACGKKIAVQASTVQVEDIEAKSKACKDAGKPEITIDQYQGQDEATAAVVSGKDEAGLADSPIAAYAVSKAPGLQLLGEIYDAAPYGYVVKKGSPFGKVLADATKALIADGTYTKVLSEWGVEGGGITDPAVDPAS